jgi:hypothetical protein
MITLGVYRNCYIRSSNLLLGSSSQIPREDKTQIVYALYNDLGKSHSTTIYIYVQICNLVVGVAL